MPLTSSVSPSGPAGLRSRLAYPALILLTLILLCSEGWQIWTAREARLEEAQIAAANLARALLSTAESEFAQASSITAAIAEQLETEGTGPASLTRVGWLMRRQLHAPSALRNISVYGADGTLLFTSFVGAAMGTSIADRGYFRAHREDAGLGLQVGSAIRSRLDGQWIIPLSRRYADASGHLGGVVVAALEIGAFTQEFGGYDLGRGGMVALLRTDGRLLARVPADEAVLGSPVLNRTPFREPIAPLRSGHFHFASPVDEVDRVGAYRVAEGYPIAVAIGFGVEDVLARWTSGAVLRAASAIPVGGLLLLLGLGFIRQSRLRRDAEHRAAEGDSWAQLVAEHSGDMLSQIGPDGRVDYVSPSAVRVLGLPARALLGRFMEDVIHPEDRPVLRAALEAVRQPGAQEEILLRVTRPDGSPAWIDASLRGLGAHQAAAPGSCLAVLRDATGRKAIEERMSALAMTDALTGLANRQRFDALLAAEWSRCSREGGWVAVLLLDLDHFRGFNEENGHAAGDDALRAVARAVDAAIRRPADVAARHGGDRFAVILPRTDMAGAQDVAERVRLAVAATAIPHRAARAGSLTASLGLAATQPLPGALPDASVLVDAAEAALHEAKRTGRNRVVEAPSIIAIQTQRQGHH
ncbi:sensor domain-containing diguanylate cyclase [Muricoccus roseus]|uniref:sensor domain-containing diguanylate cyclase n=1 Tax=Muricoccus roseus TaxID=198092 RepID=UPI0009343A08|nr:diguanylate cyclase [Roseomonas rosea]